MDGGTTPAPFFFVAFLIESFATVKSFMKKFPSTYQKKRNPFP
jgi:hypothetical protein